MENLIFSINVILPIFIMMGLGILLKYLKLYDNQFLKTANNLAFKTFLPTLLFYNIYRSDFVGSFSINIVVFSIFIIIIAVSSIFIIVQKLEKENKNRGVLVQGLFRSNFVLFGIPICSNLFGDSSLGVTSMLIAVVVPLFNFFAVLALTVYNKEKFSFKKTMIKILKNPLIIGSVLGITVAILNIKLVPTVETAVKDISQIATPFALILLGGEFEIKNVRKNIKYIFWVCLGKLIIFPTIALSLAIAFGFRGIELGALLAMTASPIAVSSFVMAQQMDANYELAGELVVFTTAFSAISIFLFVYVFKIMGFI